MRESRYSFSKFRAHTESVRRAVSEVLAEHYEDLEQAVVSFDLFFAGLDQDEDVLRRNARKLLACKFINHVYSSFVLAESGLMVDAVLCERNAWEVLAFHWLVCLDRSAAEEYERRGRLRPVDVRRRLEQLGVDVSYIQSLYSSGSEVSHVGRASERFQLAQRASDDELLLIGGAFVPDDQKHMLEFLSAFILLFERPVMVGDS